MEIMDQLRDIQRKKYHEKLAAPPFILMNWLYFADSELQVLMLDEVVNHKVWPLYNHPILMQKLLNICIETTQIRYIKADAKKDGDTIDIISQYYGYSKRQSVNIAHMFTTDDIKEMKKDLGL